MPTSRIELVDGRRAESEHGGTPRGRLHFVHRPGADAHSVEWGWGTWVKERPMVELRWMWRGGGARPGRH
eukprot:7638787-Pyramimonas_sp.AAC.1